MSLSQQAYHILKEKIVFLELEPGSVLDESTLQVRLGLGRTPIREALKRLEQEQLVTIIPRRGMFVSEISITDLYQIFELRLALESLATRLAARRGSESDWQAMDETLHAIPWDVASERQLMEIDEACHAIIYAAAGNHFLSKTLTTYYALSLRLWYFFVAQISDMRTAVHEHAQIYEALYDGNGEEAVRLMEAHILGFQTEIQTVMLGSVPERG